MIERRGATNQLDPGRAKRFVGAIVKVTTKYENEVEQMRPGFVDAVVKLSDDEYTQARHRQNPRVLLTGWFETRGEERGGRFVRIATASMTQAALIEALPAREAAREKKRKEMQELQIELAASIGSAGDSLSLANLAGLANSKHSPAERFALLSTVSELAELREDLRRLYEHDPNAVATILDELRPAFATKAEPTIVAAVELARPSPKGQFNDIEAAVYNEYEEFAEANGFWEMLNDRVVEAELEAIQAVAQEAISKVRKDLPLSRAVKVAASDVEMGDLAEPSKWVSASEVLRKMRNAYKGTGWRRKIQLGDNSERSDALAVVQDYLVYVRGTFLSLARRREYASEMRYGFGKNVQSSPDSSSDE